MAAEHATRLLLEESHEPRSRRRFVADSIRTLGAIATLPGWHSGSPEPSPAIDPWLWALDANGDGVLDAADRRILTAALEQRRGAAPRAADGWDTRADVLAQGRVRQAHVRRLDAALGQQLAPRPLVVCWHYGWYGRRRTHPTTVRYLGGNYASASRAVEEEFNALKEEFGISADLLSWADRSTSLDAYASGYLAARNRRRRRLGLLYEAAISLRTRGRVDFSPATPHADRLEHDFRRMGSWLRRAGEPLLRVDGRPVLYLFGSHTFGTAHSNLPHVGQALVRARAAFAGSFGTAPYLIGDESLFPGDAGAGPDRLYRARFLDATTRYHHYDERHVRQIGDGRTVALGRTYRHRLVGLERRTRRAFADTANQFTGRALEVIPSSAAGFAKRGLPTLSASGSEYAALLADMQRLIGEAPAGRAGATPPLVFVGSWNEEYEGHALMPAARNRALGPAQRDGFDWLYAIKALYGWNHWAARDPEVPGAHQRS